MRSAGVVDDLLRNGIDRVIVGSAAVENPGEVQALAQEVRRRKDRPRLRHPPRRQGVPRVLHARLDQGIEAHPVGSHRFLPAARPEARVVHRRRARWRAAGTRASALYAEARQALSADRTGRPRAACARAADLARARCASALRPPSAARPCSRKRSALRSYDHSCQTHHPLPRRPRRPGRKGHSLPRSPDRGRHPRARASAIATKARTRWCSTTSPRAPKVAVVDRNWMRPRRRRCSTFRSAWPAASARSRMPRPCSMPARKRSPSTRRRSANPALIEELASRFGSQCVVIGIDSARRPGWLSRVPVHRRSESLAQLRPRHAGLGARSAGTRRRRDRAQLHDQRWRAARLRRRAAAGRARDLRRAAGGLGWRRRAGALRRRFRQGRASTRRSRPACSTPAPSRSRI